MPPSQPGTPRDFRPPHTAVVCTANTPPGTPRQYYGLCLAGDFVAPDRHLTQGAAMADVTAHLQEVERQPHRVFINMIPDPPRGYVGFCAAGDFSPLVRRAMRGEAEGDVAGHVAAMGQSEPVATPTSTVTVLIDDVRRFRDQRPCRSAQTSDDGVALLQSLRGTRIDHLWLDHDLIGDDTIWPVVHLLEDAHLQGCPFDIGVVHVHASRAGPAHQMVVSLRRAEYNVTRSLDLRMWTR